MSFWRAELLKVIARLKELQPLDSDLTAIAALSTTAYGRGLLESVSASALFASIKQTATTSASGVVTLGTEVRERLTANRTYYVRTDGSDSNTGLVNNSGGAFLTVQKAIDIVAGLDCSIYSVTIQIADGTYSAGLTLKPVLGAGTYTITGNTTTPANVVISATSAAAVLAFDAGSWSLDGLKLQTTTSGQGINAIGNRTSLTIRRIDFGTAAGAQHILASSGARVFANATTLTISGGTGFECWSAVGHGSIQVYSTTVTVTASFTITRFVSAGTWGLIDSGSVTFSLGAFTITGQRYNATGTGGGIMTNGGGASYFPGTTAGAATAPGWYV